LRAVWDRAWRARTDAKAASRDSEPAGELDGQRPAGGQAAGADRQATWEALAAPFWQCHLEGYDPGIRLLPVEPRFPFFDLRLVRYLLAIPPIPWCLNKTLLRRAMRGMLPDSVRLRPKTPLAADPVLIHFQQGAAGWIDRYETPAELANPLTAGLFPLKLDRSACDGEHFRQQLGLVSLDLWLRQQTSLAVTR
jgi:asparagine synthase (glutamine-hydrolysing)